MNRRRFQNVFYKLNRHRILYPLWLFFLFNVFTLKQLTIDETENVEVKELDIVKYIEHQSSVSFQESEKVKTILMWNPWYGDFGFTLDDDSSFSRMGCKVTNCVLSKNKTKVIPEQADAIVFLYTNLCELPKIHGRQGFQRFVLLTDDPPMCYPRNYFERDNHFGSFFNWTISYRENADITWKRGWIEKLLDQPLKIRHSFPQIGMRENWKKKKLVGWYVARCGSKSKREGYINELREYIEVDSYGPCGTKSCPETNGTPTAAILPCLDMLAENYKFVLAFERFICDDFVTKRFFDLLSRDTVPIVFGGADYKLIAPPHSFIDALSFNPKELADHLLKLEKDEKHYFRHFWWKDVYKVHSGYGELASRPFCDLCEKLNSNLPRKIYRNLDDWWYNNTKCSAPEDRGIVIRHNGTVDDLHSIQIPWSFDD
ncbi:alpha-(1,3)-fucosyltransferase C-like [Daphnia pulex]|uniref:alpha-(1,3)-fucosyltransferase C-like n=1 Tax=Daphnia pulex TaxID=6669 RepID=UPI001EDD61BC|nr:alpha-(1,3)-fucosyltransferase C-like [Daphnia pulex]